MGNYAATKSELRDFIGAKTPLVVIESTERNRVEQMLREVAGDLIRDVFYYTDVKQVVNLGPSRTTEGGKDVSGDPGPFAGELFTRRKGVVFALGDNRRLTDDNLYTRELLSLVFLAAESGNTLVLVAPEPIWPRLARFGLVTRLDMPDLGERMALVERFVEECGARGWSPEECQHMAMLLRGLSEAQITNLMRAELAHSGVLSPDDMASIVARKERLFAQASSVQQVRLHPDMNVAGLASLKSWLDEKRPVFFARDDELRTRGIEPPKGILLVGVPGCGKSFSARMIAQTWGLPLFRFDIGSVYDKYVGESERRMQEALDYIDNVAPCVLWIDEIEKALSISDTGNDTGKRVLGQFLFWLQESSARAFLIATANDIQALPPELFRKGRFSEVFFVDLPNAEERSEAVRNCVSIGFGIEASESLLARAAEVTEGYSYADIEYAVMDYTEEIVFRSGGDFDESGLLAALRSAISISVRNPELINHIQTWGTDRARPAS